VLRSRICGENKFEPVAASRSVIYSLPSTSPTLAKPLEYKLDKWMVVKEAIQ